MSDPKPKPKPDNGGCFLIVWLYLMILAISLAPVIADYFAGAPS